MLAEKGVKIGIFDLNEERGEAVASELGGAFAKVNVTNEEETDAGFEKIRAALGQERILINCAGTGKPSKPHRAIKKPAIYRTFPRCVQSDYPDQSGRHVPLHRQISRRHDDAGSAGMR